MIEKIYQKRVNVTVDSALFKRVEDYCKKNLLYKNDFMNKVINENIEEMNNMDLSLRQRKGNEKMPIQIVADERYYDTIEKPRVARVEKMLEKILSELESEKK